MSYEEFQRRLSENWLDPKEASVYVMLAKSGSLKASEVARLCDIRRMDTYRILKRLETKGIVETGMGRPMKFQAVSPEKAFDMMLKSESEKISTMRSEKNYLLSLWPTQPTLEEDRKNSGKFRIIQGRAEYFSALRRVITSTCKEVSIVTTQNGLSRLFHIGFDKELEEKAATGISIKILCRLGEGETEAVDRFASIVNVRYLTNPLNTQIVLADGLHAIVSTALDDSMSLSSEKDTNIWTNSLDQIAIFQALFEELWHNSLDLKTARALTKMGAISPALRRLVGHEAANAFTQAALKSAKSSITIMTRSITLSPLFKDEYLSLLKEAHLRGVRIRVMTTMKGEDIGLVKEISNYFDLRASDIEPTMNLSLVDKTVFIGTKPLISGESPLQQETIYISESAYASLIDQFLDIAWSRADNITPMLHSMEWIEHTNVILQRAAEILNTKGVSAETPGMFRGSSSLEYTFSLVARKKNDQRCVVVERCGDSQKIMSIYAKTVDCDVQRTILLTPPGFQEEASKLASFFSMKVLPLARSEEDHKKIAKAVLDGFS